jgi:biopolymer transport protein ExbD
MEFAEHERPRPKLSIAPLIDVVFLLLVFFMLASSFIEPAAIDLAMPRQEAAPQPQLREPLVVDVAMSGAVRLNGLDLALDQLGAELAARAGADPDRPVTVRAEAAVPVQRLVSVMDQVRGAGLINVRLATPAAR